MLIGLCSLKSSPGVTTTTLALAGCWPAHLAPPTVIELDARGGDIAWRYGFAADPGLRSLAAAARLDPEPSMLPGHARPVGGSMVLTVTAPAEREPARQAVAALMPLLRLLRDSPETVLLDLGEIDPRDTGTADLLAGLASLLVVSRAVPEQVARVAEAAADLRLTNSNTRVLYIGDLRDRDAERLVDLPSAGVLPLIDPGASTFARLVSRRSRKAFGSVVVRVAEGLAALTKQPGSDPLVSPDLSEALR
ncbi:hypothetical protein KGQ19_01245 [Catenulispora sp. NL8]|uniref:Uncharacterized protein n=1 Tax=Catenulispora pinistramenti TaxID=2705254 RepID=A0ABS5KHW2_9ACTN|nr:hypothetical protein [Catenulispora pinistramenti]MBS2545485.1 hypothetical protein [Catenulispora pinistramenti]